MKRAAKITSIVIIALLAVIAISAISLRLYYSDRRLKSMIEKRAGEAMGHQITIGGLELGGWISLRIRDFSIRDSLTDSIWLKIDELDVDLDPRALLSKKIHLDRIALKGGNFNYGMFPQSDTTAAVSAGKEGPFISPLRLEIDTFFVDDLRISGPEADFTLGLSVGDLTFKSIDDFSLDYDLEGKSGRLHFVSNSLGADADFSFSLIGSVSSTGSEGQEFEIIADNIKLATPDAYDIGGLEIGGRTTAKIKSREIIVDSVGISLNDRPIINFTGSAALTPKLRLEIDADSTSWRVAGFADLANRLNLPLKPEGLVALNEGRFIYTPAGIMYDFALDISDLGFELGDNLKVEGVNGQIYSDGDLGQIVFGSSLTVRSLSAVSPDGSRINLKGISSSVEAEISESEYSLNITSGIVDVLGGKLDFSAFSQNSKVTGELRISDINLAQMSSQAAGLVDTTILGLLNLRVDIGGVLDSVTANLRARAKDVTIVAGKDTLSLGDQDLEINSTTLLRNKKLESSVDYSFGPLIKGKGDVKYPLREATGDSLVLSFDLDIDNSILPRYFPPSLSTSLGAVDISGWSGLKGRLASPADSIVLQGKSELSIRPTDLLVEDFQSLLFQLVSFSEVEITKDGIDVSFSGDVGELYAEEYSDLPFPDIKFKGKIISTSDTTWELTDAIAEIPSINSRILARGDFGVAGGVPYSNFILGWNFQSDQPVALNSMISIKGILNVEAALNQKGDEFGFSGELSLENITLLGKNGLNCEGIDGKIPFNGIMNTHDSLFVKSVDKQPLNRSTYRRSRWAGPSQTGFGTVKVTTVYYGDIAATDIETDLIFKNGVIDIPYLSGKILGGSFIGDLLIDLRDINLMRNYPDYEKVKYDVSFETADLDFNQLAGGFGPFESKANFTSSAYFQGRGIPAPGGDYSIDGMFHISQMGPQVLNRVLDFIDPTNQNPGVVQTKSLLNKKLLGVVDLSYKPKEFIIEIKYGALYPGLYMSQPFYADFIPLMRIPMPIRYGRIPLNTILTGMEETK